MEWRECRGGDFFFVMRRRPPRSTLVPYTTLFRSVDADAQGTAAADLARPRLQPGRRGSDDVDRLAADEDVDAVRLDDVVPVAAGDDLGPPVAHRDLVVAAAGEHAVGVAAGIDDVAEVRARDEVAPPVAERQAPAGDQAQPVVAGAAEQAGGPGPRADHLVVAGETPDARGARVRAQPVGPA